MSIQKKLLTLIILFFLSCSLGYTIGLVLLAKTISGSSSLSFFITRPLFFHLLVNEKLYSKNPLDRLTGYYALYDFRVADRDFLYERYKQEESIASKRMILKILALHPGKDLFHFLDEVYELSDKTLKIQIVNIVKNQYPDKLNAFAQKHKVDVQWIHSDK